MGQDRKWLAKDHIALAYASYNRYRQRHGWPGRDREVRHPIWTRRLLDAFGAPDKQSLTLCVTGSKGKGSHAILMAAMLQALGLRVGLFTGPHLVDFMERFRINGRMMPEEDFMRLMDEVWAAAQTLPVPDDQYIGPVGLLAVLAARWFAESGTDVNVVELGRGALHDDVNQWHHEGAVVAPIFLEHVWELGPTLFDVAREKAGIIRGETKAVFSNSQQPICRDVLRARAAAYGAALIWTDDSEDPSWLTDATVSGAAEELPPYLLENARTAWRAVRWAAEQLGPRQRLRDFTFDLRRVRLPGRMQVVRRHPLTIVDGCIHATSAALVARSAARYRNAGRRVGAVIGIPADKDVRGVLAALRDVADLVILTAATNPHLRFDYSHVADMASAFPMGVREVPNVAAAVDAADAVLTSEDVLLLLGTQSFVGDVLRLFQIDTGTVLAVEGSGEPCGGRS